MGSSCRSAILSVFANYPELLWPSQEAPPPDCALSLALAALRRELLSRPRNCAPFSTFAINHLEKQFEPGAEGGPYPIQHLLLNSILHNFEITVIILPFFFFKNLQPVQQPPSVSGEQGAQNTEKKFSNKNVANAFP